MVKTNHGKEDDGKRFVFIDKTDLAAVLVETGLTDEQRSRILETVNEFNVKYDALHDTYSPTYSGNTK